MLDVSSAATVSGALGAELKAVKNTLDSIYEWLQAESGKDSDGESEDDAGSGMRGGKSKYDQSGDDSYEGMLDSAVDDRSGASIHSNISSAQALYGTRNSTPPIPAAEHRSFADTNGLFQKQSATSQSLPSETTSYGPIRVGIVTFDSNVHFYSVKMDALDPISKCCHYILAICLFIFLPS